MIRSSWLYFLFLFFLLGCQSKQKESLKDRVLKTETVTAEDENFFALSESVSFKQNPDFELKVDSILSASLQRIPITIVNHADIELRLGSDYTLEYYCDSLSQWQNARFPPYTAHTKDLHIVKPNSSYEMNIYVYGNKAGKYKVTKTGEVFNEFHNKYLSYLLVGEFVLSNCKRK